ncbi:MAG: hypothetical protein U0174_24165 [Polyangiaceae bacterium]
MLGVRRFLLLPLALGVGVVGSSACQTPTQLTLEFTTDLPCTSVKDVSITVGAPGTIETARAATTVEACTNGYIGTIAVVPSGAKDGRIAIRAVLGVDVRSDQCTAETKYQGCIVVRRELSFVPRSTLLVPIGFYAACRNVACDGNTTCKGRGECVSSNQEPGRAPDGGMLLVGDGGTVACMNDGDCPPLATKPEKCAVGRCSNQTCVYVSVDADGDQDPTSNCEAQDPNVPLKVGTDCDDGDPNIHGSLARACGGSATCKPGKQACEPSDPRKVGPCVGAQTPQAFNCDNGLDNDCNGVIDADELAPIAGQDVGKVCANLYRCPKGSVDPSRAPLCRDGAFYTLDCLTVDAATLVGYAPTTSAAVPVAGAARLLISQDKTRVFPSNVTNSCCPNCPTAIPLCSSGGTCTYTQTVPMIP